MNLWIHGLLMPSAGNMWGSTIRQFSRPLSFSISIFSTVVGYFWSCSSFWGTSSKREVCWTFSALNLNWRETRPGRTLEETAALFDGEQPQHDLVRLGGDAATLTVNLSRGVVPPLIRRTEKSTDYSPEVFLELRRSYASQSGFKSQTDSRRQSQESAIAVAI
jgi:hypothetical protein